MDNNVIALIEELLLSNTKLQQLAEADEWDAFLDEAEAYSMGRRTLGEIDLTQLAQHNKPQVSAQLTTLLENDAILTGLIQRRMATIRSELSGMRKSNTMKKAYTAV
ncbi:flagellar protein FliT [Enterobacter sp. 22452]|uniref:flagellar protein FliT n=1 Tax=Enterobacter TaxID=547 RepID=UPI003F867974